MTTQAHRGRISLFICLLLFSFSAATAGQTVKLPSVGKQASSPYIRWDDVMGEDKDTPNAVYCLMGSGFIMAPTSANIKKLISVWIAKHPQARTVRVSTFGPIMVDQPNSTQTYVWVIDGQIMLNEYLVRRGACPGGTMQIPDYGELSPKSGKTGGAPFHFKVYVTPQESSHFLKRIERAEVQAQKEKLGIWKHGTANVY